MSALSPANVTWSALDPVTVKVSLPIPPIITAIPISPVMLPTDPIRIASEPPVTLVVSSEIMFMSPAGSANLSGEELELA